jgi:hypothetical protein
VLVAVAVGPGAAATPVDLAARPGCRPQPRCHAGRGYERNLDPYRQILLSPRWQKTRKLVRARDQDRCRLEGVGEPCGGRIEVHHIVGVRQGGALFDPATARASAAYVVKNAREFKSNSTYGQPWKIGVSAKARRSSKSSSR